MRTITVALDLRTYPIHIGDGLLSTLGAMVRDHGFRQKEALIITNPQIGALYAEATVASLTGAGFTRVLKHEIPASEQGKNWEELSKTCAALRPFRSLSARLYGRICIWSCGKMTVKKYPLLPAPLRVWKTRPAAALR